MIRQGDIHWIDLGAPRGSGPGYRRSCVVVQNDAFNASSISTVIVAVITSNLGLGRAFGNVALRKGEAGLPRKSVVNVSQIATVDRTRLSRRVGRLGKRRLEELFRGLLGVLRPVYGAAEPEERNRTLREIASLWQGRKDKGSR